MRRGLVLLASLVILAYAGICGLFHAKQRGMIYFPGLTQVAAADTDFALTRGDVTLRGWALNPGQRDAVIYFGGNAESINRMHGHLAHWLPDHSTYLLSYRGYGASEGEPSEAALQEDALALFDEVQARHPGGKVSVIGRSLGSGVASHLASRRPVHRLVLVTPFASLSGVAQHHYPWLPVGLLIKDRYESAAHLSGFRQPVLVIRAGKDRIVPAFSTAELIAALPRPALEVVVAEADHDSVFATPGPGEDIARFLSR